MARPTARLPAQPYRSSFGNAYVTSLSDPSTAHASGRAWRRQTVAENPAISRGSRAAKPHRSLNYITAGGEAGRASSISDLPQELERSSHSRLPGGLRAGKGFFYFPPPRRLPA